MHAAPGGAGARCGAWPWALVVAAALAWSAPHATGAGRRAVDPRLCETLAPEQTRFTFRQERWDLRDPGDLRALGEALDREMQSLDSAKGPEKDPPQPAGDSLRRALAHMRSLTEEALGAKGSPCAALVEIAEIGDSLDLDTRPPVPKRLDVIQVPFYYWNIVHSPVGIGKDRAVNLARVPAPGSDASLVDPLPSTFWSRPKDIASIDLYEEFGPILKLGSEPCTYDEPKVSYGTTPGFSMKCGEREIKVKFGAIKFGAPENSERDSEAAATRLFGAVGFHVEPNDHAPEVRVRYDRRLILEFNSRKDMTLTITAFGFIPVYRVKVQSDEDPFQYIRSARMKSGEELSSEALANKLIRADVLGRSVRAAKKNPKGTQAGHYRDDAAVFERGIDHLVLMEANIQLRASGGQNIGPWGWDRLGHARRRELRGAALLAAWINYFDARWDNNRLKFLNDDRTRDAGLGDDRAGDDRARTTHFISDLGGAFGRADGVGADQGNRVNDFPWTFTEGPVKYRGRETKPFRIVGYKPIFQNAAFREMTLDDARWMARLIGQLTENQIELSLIANGFTSAEVKLFTEKLISRRDAMIKDLGLAGEIAPLRPLGSRRWFDYDPRKEGPVRATRVDGSELTPIESADLVVRGGKVVPR